MKTKACFVNSFIGYGWRGIAEVRSEV